MQKFTFSPTGVKKIKAVFGIAATVVISLTATGQSTTPASAVWPLTTDSLPTTAGNITAPGEIIGSGLTGVLYGSSFDNSTNTGWKRHGTVSSLPVGYSDSAYVQYSVTPTAGNYLRVTQLDFSALGGGTGTARLAVYYSRNNGATWDSMPVAATYNGLTYRATRNDSIVLLNTSTTNLAGREVVTFPGMSIVVNPGQTLSFRMYPWITAAGTRYFPSKQISITGVTSTTALPVIFSTSKAAQKNSGIQVDWSTASESNLSTFVIERSSNGSSFAPVATVAAKGSASGATNYSWYDAAPLAGNNFYRIKAVNKDGSILYTSILRVNLSGNFGELVIAPNPVRSHTLNLQLSNFDKGVYSINVFNGQGQKVFTSSINHTGGSATQSFQLPANIKAGMYSLQLGNGLTLINKNLIVE
jgi:hypothetical protein